MDLLHPMNSKNISLMTKIWRTLGLTFLLTIGTKELAIDLVIINGEMAYHHMIAKEVEDKATDIQDQETMYKNLFKTIHGDSNWNS